MAKYTDKFLKVPIIKYDNAEAELFDRDPHDCTQMDTYKMINVFKLIAYEPTIPKGLSLEAKNEIWTAIFFEGEADFILPIPVNEFEDLLNAHQNK